MARDAVVQQGKGDAEGKPRPGRDPPDPDLGVPEAALRQSIRHDPTRDRPPCRTDEDDHAVDQPECRRIPAVYPPEDLGQPGAPTRSSRKRAGRSPRCGSPGRPSSPARIATPRRRGALPRPLLHSTRRPLAVSAPARSTTRAARPEAPEDRRSRRPSASPRSHRRPATPRAPSPAAPSRPDHRSCRRAPSRNRSHSRRWRSPGRASMARNNRR